MINELMNINVVVTMNAPVVGKREIICFDVDGTLITFDNKPRYDVIMALMFFVWRKNCDVYIWSGGGQDYAEHWAEKLGLLHAVKGALCKGDISPTLTFDDEDCDFGCVNIIV